MIKSARVMKKSVSVLIPYMEKEKQKLLPEGAKMDSSVSSTCDLQIAVETDVLRCIVPRGYCT